MKLYIVLRNSNVSATGEYDPATKMMLVLKGSRVSDEITRSATFRGVKTIEKNRASAVKDGIVTDNISFRSASTAANFVTGRSSNGLLVWKDKSGHTLKDILSEV